MLRRSWLRHTLNREPLMAVEGGRRPGKSALQEGRLRMGVGPHILPSARIWAGRGYAYWLSIVNWAVLLTKRLGIRPTHASTEQQPRFEVLDGVAAIWRPNPPLAASGLGMCPRLL